MVDQFVLDQLSSEEKIEYEHYVKNIDVFWYATNKRILKYKKNWWTGISLQDLDYKYVVSIDFEEKRYYWLLILAAILGSLGFLFIQLKEDIFYWIGFLGVTILLVIIAIFYKPTYYQFYAPSIKSGDWIIMFDTETERAKEFIQTIRKHCFFDNPPSSE
ncbi:MAG: hypothetical protein KKD46_03160 [Euryarchaeota archaeon]|nr:hypothetical protein [Euryarchaeota archaeon]MCG2735396.1 hypothetical protein [Candidatus Methanoperedenaceae archaeon]